MSAHADPCSAIEQRVYLPVSVERVWKALTDREEFQHWWGGTLAAPLSVGATATLLHQGRAYTFDVDEMVPPTRLGWRWHPGERNATQDYSGERKTRTIFDIRPFHQGSLLTIREAGFDIAPLSDRPQAFADNVNGWLYQGMALLAHVTATP